MSLTVDGVWKVGVWATTVWADGVWYEGAPAPATAATTSGAPGQIYQNGYMAEVNGVLRHFATLEDLREFLASFTKKQKQKLRKRTKVTKVEVPRIEIPAQTAQPAAQLIQRANASMEVYYWQQYELLIQAQDEDDEESIIALFG